MPAQLTPKARRLADRYPDHDLFPSQLERLAWLLDENHALGGLTGDKRLELDRLILRLEPVGCRLYTGPRP